MTKAAWSQRKRSWVQEKCNVFMRNNDMLQIIYLSIGEIYLPY